ncbi:MAG: hypothetical protein V1685_00145 [Parcubacteria group bacterium]
MEFGFEIERKNYILFIGWPPKWLETARYVFDGWKNNEQKKRFFGSVSFLSQEAGAGRISPALSDAKILFIKDDTDEVKGEGTVAGTVLKVAYDNRGSNPEKIENFFEQSGITIHRADPFIKPIKTIGRILKEKIRK